MPPQIFGCSFTLFSHDVAAPPIMTGWAPGRGAARWYVERLMERDPSVFRGFIRDLLSCMAEACARSRNVGEFVWMPARPTIRNNGWGCES